VLPSGPVDDRLARRPAAIRGMFAAVAPRYDLLNRLLSLRQDVRWRRRQVAALTAAPPGPVLDLATGTGDVAFAIAGRQVTGADFCVDMLALARAKAHRRRRQVSWVAADGLVLPFRDGAFAAVTVAFGVRNFANLIAGLAEIRRVLAAHGVLAILEFQRPARAAVRLVMRAWNRAVVAPLGSLLSHDAAAYAYLPASVETFPDAGELARAVGEAGLRVESSHELSWGIVALTVARAPRREGV
jgi:demethylmenaquinone methyltransferase / 2-methoxy-6-polyprenyl-1,4-benzoquinol methylase